MHFVSRWKNPEDASIITKRRHFVKKFLQEVFAIFLVQNLSVNTVSTFGSERALRAPRCRRMIWRERPMPELLG